MKVMVFNGNKEETLEAESVLKKHGLKISKTPDAIITLGGDGTFLLAEQKYPGIPKILVRSKSKICVKCSNYSLEKVALALKQGKFQINEFDKVEALAGKKKLVGINEASIRNSDQRVALRFSLDVGNENKGDFIGDGVIVSTPFGSSAYYYSITGKTFDSGLGVALNNTSRKTGPFMTDEEVVVRILRENATLTCDNGKFEKLKAGDVVRIRKSGQTAKIISL